MNTQQRSSSATASIYSPSPNSLQQPVPRDTLFFDVPSINNSIVNEQSRNRSFLSFAGSNTEVSEGCGNLGESASGGAGPSDEVLERRGQTYRRSNAGGAAAATATPRMRSLEDAAVSLRADVERTRSNTGPSSSAAASDNPIGMLMSSTNAPGDHLESSSSISVPLSNLHDSIPLLSMAPTRVFRSASKGNGRDDDSGSDEVGSVQVKTAPSPPQLYPGPVHSPHESPPHADEESDASRGFELSMDSVYLQVRERRYFRFHPVTYLDNCTLHIAPGSVHCITSLNPVYARAALAVLGGLDSVAGAEGAALANCFPTSSLRYRRQVAYVASLDGCTEEATVYDNLVFATQMRFHVDDVTLRNVVLRAASDVFLMDYLHIRVSHLGPARRYLLATAMELVVEPAVLLLEDPLSFFSLAELQLFTRLLRNVRQRNPARTVVWSGATIPWTLFDDIDTLTLLTTGGKTFFSGAKKNVEPFLQQDLGILRVPGEDVLDIMAQTELDAVAVAHATVSFSNSVYYREAQEELEAHRTRIATDAYATAYEASRPAPPYLRVQVSLLKYALRRHVWGRAALIPWIGLFAVMVIVCIFVAMAVGEAHGNLQNTCGVLFLLLSCTFQINSIFFKSELREWRTFLTFKNNLYVSVTPYFVATIVRLVVPRLCFAIAGSICGAVIFAQSTAVALSMMMSLLSFSHVCLGLVAVYWFPRIDFLLIMSYLYYGYCVIISGFLLSITQVPTFFQGLSFLRIAYGGLLAMELDGVLYGCKNGTTTGIDAASLSSSASAGAAGASRPSSTCFSGSDYLRLMGLQNDSLWKAMLALSLMSLFAMAVLGLSMRLAPRMKLLSST